MIKTIRNSQTFFDKETEKFLKRIPRIVECDSCLAHLECPNFTNTCKCGLEYNSSGQKLAPRSQWGEETGESPYNIGRIK